MSQRAIGLGNLVTIAGNLPPTSPFDILDRVSFRTDSRAQPEESPPLLADTIWFSPSQERNHGVLFIDYPFAEACSGLTLNSSNPTLARETSSRIDAQIDHIVAQSEKIGMHRVKSKWAVDELLLNATQYGCTSLERQSAGLIRLDWSVDRDEAGPFLALAVSNPCQKLFDPSLFARMENLEFLSFFDDDETKTQGMTSNGHLGTIKLLGSLKEGTKITYLWEVDDGRIRITLEPLAADASDAPENFDDLMAPTRVVAEKFDGENNHVAYDFEAFLADIADGKRGHFVTVSLVVQG